MNKKSLIAAIFSIPLVLSSTASAASLTNDKDNNNNPKYETRSVNVNISLADGGNGVYRYNKTVVKYYHSFNSIPSKLYYEEFDSGKQVWMRGYLHRDDINQLNSNYYKVTFSGTLNG